jgi:hypothetical protein
MPVEGFGERSLAMQVLRYLLKTISIFALASLGAKAIGDGWRVLGTREFRVEGDLGHGGLISIDGGYGEIGLGILLLFWAWLLLQRWFLDVPPPVSPRKGALR